MQKEKRSFFERLTGTVSLDDYDDHFEDGEMHTAPISETKKTGSSALPESEHTFMGEEAEEGQLAVDVYQTVDAIIIKALVAGVKPDDLDVAITRDMVTIKGKRESGDTVSDGDFFYQELYWGAFSRTIVLPQEVDVDGAQATEKYGFLTIILPKLDKAKQTRLKVRGA